jgi:hypothetical protein
VQHDTLNSALFHLELGSFIGCSATNYNFKSFQTNQVFLFYENVVNKKAIEFCKLVLYPLTLLMSVSFWVEFFGPLTYKIMSSANRDSLTSTFHICIPFISSSCLIAFARNSKTMLNNKQRE